MPTVDEPIQKEAGETFVAAAVIDQILDRMVGDDLVIGAVAVDRIEDEQGTETADLTVTDEAANTEPYVSPSDDETYAIGKVIFFTLSGGTEGQTYRIFFTVTIAAGVSTPEQTITVIVPVELVRWGQ